MGLEIYYDINTLKHKIVNSRNARHLFNRIKYEKETLEYFIKNDQAISSYIDNYQEIITLMGVTIGTIDVTKHKVHTTFRLGQLIKIHVYVIERYNSTQSIVFKRIHEILNEYIETHNKAIELKNQEE